MVSPYLRSRLFRKSVSAATAILLGVGTATIQGSALAGGLIAVLLTVIFLAC